MAIRKGNANAFDSGGSYYRDRQSKKVYIPEVKPIYRSSAVRSDCYIKQSYHAHGTVVSSDIDQYWIDPSDSFFGQASDLFTGITNPYWKDEIRGGANATTIANGRKFNIENGWYSASISGDNGLPPPNDFSFNEDVFGYPPLDYPFKRVIDSDVLDGVNNRAINRFLAKAEAVLSSIEAGQDLGEYRQSISSMIRPLSSLKQHVLGYFPKVQKLGKGLRGRTPKARKVALERAIADTYLELHFGWTPLAADVANAYENLTNNQYFQTYPIKATAKVDFFGSNEPMGQFNLSGLYKTVCNKRTTSSYTVRYIGSVWSKADSDGRRGVAQSLQLDLPHFIPTVWDLLPYSFIADYFVNIGDIIRAKSFVTSNIRWVCRTDRQKDSNEYSAVETASSSAAKIGGFKLSGWKARAERVSFQRIPWNPNSLVPVLHFQLPHSEKPWENIGAIIASRALPVTRYFQALSSRGWT